MERTLEVINGNYRETMKWLIDGKVHLRRTNDKARIYEDMHSLTEPNGCYIDGNNLKIYYDEENTLILKDYKKNTKKYLLYREKVTQVLQRKDSIPIAMKPNKFQINKKKIAALLLAGSMILANNPFTRNNTKPVAEEVNDTRIEMQKQAPKLDLLAQYSIEPIKSRFAEEETIEIEAPIEAEESLEERLENLKQIQEGVLANSSVLPVGTRLTPYALNRMVNFMNSRDGQYVEKYAEMFGVPPYALTSLIMQESSLTANATNGYAYGYGQLESPSSPRTIRAINVLTGEESVETINMQTATDPEKNIKITAMMLQNCLRKFDNNIYLALQGYTFGDGLVSLVVSKYADRIGVTREEVMANYADLGYIEDFQRIHDDPHGYVTEEDRIKYADRHGGAIRYLDNWPYKTYGDPKYIEHVMSYYIGTTCQVKTPDTVTTINLLTNQSQNTPNIGNSHMLS